ncbi:MAG: hypothetical protein KF754_06890 [Planctomycetes bacterium]|nr:hypothetical protein [Planctomycetota bacterium]
MRKAALLMLPLLCLLPTAWNAQAQDRPQPKPREFTKEEVEAAEATRLAMAPQELALLNALRFLVRPGYETELFAGRRYRPCPLPSLEERAVEPMTSLDHLRLWAVLQSGMPAGQGIENEIDRLLRGARAGATHSQLGAMGTEMGALRAVWLRKDPAHQAPVVARALELYKNSRALAAVTGPKSTLVMGEYIQPMWFAGHLWRALIVRNAHEMGVDVDAAEWCQDLRTLLSVWRTDRGWICRDIKEGLVSDVVHPNLMAMCALSLAATAPDRLVPRGLATDIQRKLADCRNLLGRLEKDYADTGFDQSRLVLIQSMGDLAPAKADAGVWRAQLMRQGLAMAEVGGAFPGGNGLQVDLGIQGPAFQRGQRATVETALVVLALCGGLRAEGPGPLAGQTLAGVGRSMLSLSVWQAANAREFADTFQGRVNMAIADGCDFIVRSQLPDGSFPGMYSYSVGNQGACVLTLLHGGYDRKHKAIERALAHIIENRRERSGTYANAIVLMALQKYYEKEQFQFGLLSAETPAAFETARGKVLAAMAEPHRKLAADLLAELEGARASGGTYGYTGAPGRTSSVIAGDRGDNSCTQYAMLGFKAASMLGLRVDIGVFTNEANRLLKSYFSDEFEQEIEYVQEEESEPLKGGKTKVRSARRVGKVRPGGWCYMPERMNGSMQMTAAGISSLALCRDELKVRGKLSEDLGWRIALTMHGAQEYMARLYYTPAMFQQGRSTFEQSSDGHGVYYNLYSVERACLLANLRTIGNNLDWYRVGADGLLDAQFEDGSWPGYIYNFQGRAERGVAMINTCMAILFLKQASMPVITEHKKRQKEAEDRQKQPAEPPRSPVTPGPEDKRKAPEPAPAEDGK